MEGREQKLVCLGSGADSPLRQQGGTDGRDVQFRLQHPQHRSLWRGVAPCEPRVAVLVINIQNSTYLLSLVK